MMRFEDVTFEAKPQKGLGAAVILAVGVAGVFVALLAMHLFNRLFEPEPAVTYVIQRGDAAYHRSPVISSWYLNVYRRDDDTIDRIVFRPEVLIDSHGEISDIRLEGSEIVISLEQQ